LLLRIHPTFHISLLKQYYENTISGRITPSSPPVIVGGYQEFEVEVILDSKWMCRHLFYPVKWKNYPVSDNSWELVTDVKNSPKLIAEFHAKNPVKPH